MFVSCVHQQPKDGVDSIFLLEQSKEQLLCAGVPFTSPKRFPFSFTYHLYTLLDLYYYYIFKGSGIPVPAFGTVQAGNELIDGYH